MDTTATPPALRPTLYLNTQLVTDAWRGGLLGLGDTPREIKTLLGEAPPPFVALDSYARRKEIEQWALTLIDPSPLRFGREDHPYSDAPDGSGQPGPQMPGGPEPVALTGTEVLSLVTSLLSAPVDLDQRDIAVQLRTNLCLKLLRLWVQQGAQ